MGLMKEFKEFAMRGNVIDLAVGVIIGGAFGKIVSSLVSDVLMPLIGLAMKGKSFADKFYALNGVKYESLEKARDAGASVIAYGSFIQTIIDFLIIAFSIFIMIKVMNRAATLRKKQEAEAQVAAEPVPTKEEQLLTEIRDLLKNKN